MFRISSKFLYIWFIIVPALMFGQKVKNVYSVLSKDSMVWIGTEYGVFRSSNFGDTWSSVNTGMGKQNTQRLALTDSFVIAATQWNVFLTSDGGDHWFARDYSNAAYLSTISVIQKNIFVGTAGFGIRRSTNNGISWFESSNGLPKSGSGSLLEIHSILGVDSKIFAGTSGSGVYVSNDQGTTWTGSGLAGTIITSLFAINSAIYAGTTNGAIHRSTDGGIQWTNVYFTNDCDCWVDGFASLGQKIYAATSKNGIIVSTDGGNSWYPSNNGLGSSYIMSIAISGTTIYAGSTASIYRSTLTDTTWQLIDSGLVNQWLPNGTEDPQRLPHQPFLDQNYPNPFNPTTVISYHLSGFGPTTLSVYDMLGREAAQLVNKVQGPGSYTVPFDASRLASGVYFAKLQSGGRTLTRKMLLMK